MFVTATSTEISLYLVSSDPSSRLNFVISHLKSVYDNPYPNGYTETGRVAKQEYMLYINWGYDGISNGWFHNGCFDMSQRIEDEIILGGYTDEYDYNFVDISYFAVTPVIHAS